MIECPHITDEAIDDLGLVSCHCHKQNDIYICCISCLIYMICESKCSHSRKDGIDKCEHIK